MRYVYVRVMPCSTSRVFFRKIVYVLVAYIFVVVGNATVGVLTFQHVCYS